MKFHGFKQQISARQKNLYPTFLSLDAAVAHAVAQFPEESRNQVIAALMGYHNTLLQTLHTTQE